MEQIRNILFDFGNVIIDIDIPGATDRLGALKSDDIDPESFENQLKELVFKFELGTISPDEFIAGVHKLSRNDVTDGQIIDAWNSMLIGIPSYRLGMLEELKPEFNLLLLSNTNHFHLDWVRQHVLKAHGIDDFEPRFFHATYYSHLIRKRKPDRRVFQHVIEDAMITPEKTLFLDDMMQNIETARAMGFQVRHSPEEEEVAETLKLLGFY